MYIRMTLAILLPVFLKERTIIANLDFVFFTFNSFGSQTKSLCIICCIDKVFRNHDYLFKPNKCDNVTGPFAIKPGKALLGMDNGYLLMVTGK